MKKRGIILEQHRNYTILLTKDGAFEKGKVITGSGQIGDEVFFEPFGTKKKSFVFAQGNRKHVSALFLSAACFLLLLILPVYFITGANKTYAYVSVDINPSIELEINKDYQVRSIRPINTDASTVVDQLEDYQNRKIETVIQMIMDKSEENGLINEHKSMLVGVSFLGDTDSDEEILYLLEDHLELSEPDWEIAAFDIPKNIRNQAKEQQLSMNEVIATTFLEDSNLSADDSNNSNLDEHEIEIIDSFYNTEEVEVEEESEIKKEESDAEEIEETEEIKQTTDERNEENQEQLAEQKDKKENAPVIISKDKKDKAAKEKQTNSSRKDENHPSNLKSKNGEINSNGRNVIKGNNGSTKSQTNHAKEQKKQKNNGKHKGKNENHKVKNGNPEANNPSRNNKGKGNQKDIE
ncbi:anti-sigma-I factor RsgI family protein [Oceanobacillus halophilus]|uniref:RsgI N-terminal anti-sigma domain-containing protein n=1 Tax=Oceanobacillus halophilus TaxID=930130 RepID=A0A495A0Q8_9BACI|nr:anti-sigma factor domain-containing protein [Oceanobacillus halophilus]RKQ31240.1 hypothetical protein D8M06_14290 [Oceanobacillus halophilus]